MDRGGAAGGGGGSNYKVKLMCSYGGKIQPRAASNQLTYVGGDTKILTLDRNIKLPHLINKLHSLCDSNFPFQLKYQLPGYDLDALVSVIEEADLENMMFEYDYLHRSSAKPSRFRIFVFLSDVRPTTTPDYLFGFDNEYNVAAPTGASATPSDVVVKSTTPDSEASRTKDTVLDENINADMDPEIPKVQIMGVEAQVMPDVYSRDNHVTSGSGSYAYGPPVYYRIPVPVASGTGYYQYGPYGGVHRVVGNPVYTLVPIFPCGHEQVSLMDGRVEPIVTTGGGGGSMQPMGMSAAAVATSTLNHETKASLQA